MPYNLEETKKSQEYLSQVLSLVSNESCLIGGYAVQLSANQSFFQEHGQNYIASRDIDLGFEMNPQWTETDIKNSAFSKCIKKIEDEIGFTQVGYHLIRYHDFHTGNPITEEEYEKKYRKRPYDAYMISIDPVIETPHPEIQKAVGFTPFEETLLSHVFRENRCKTVPYLNTNVTIPTPEVLIGMKLKAVPRREELQKKHKDVADIFAISWYSDEDFDEIRTKLSQVVEPDKISTVVDSFPDEYYEKAATMIGVEEITSRNISRVINELK